jgi:hypothetical protein
MLQRGRKCSVAAILAAAASVVTPAAFAQGTVGDCTELEAAPETYGRVLYGTGGSAVTGTLAQVALYLSARPIDERITIVYHDPGACQGYQEYLDNQITTAGATIKYWVAGSPAAGNTCTLAAPHTADFAHMGNPHDFCGFTDDDLPANYPTGYGTLQAPIQTLNIIADKDSSQRSISAEALYYIYGFGAAAANIEPWTNPHTIVFRQTSSFVHQFVAQSIFGDDNRPFYDDHGVLNTQGNGTDVGNLRLGYMAATNGNVVTRVAFYQTQEGLSPDVALGFASGSAAETASARAAIKTLAYQHYDQERGYWPDSTESTTDKRNVRSGKYHFWSPGHFYARVADDAETFGNGDLRSLDDVLDPDVRRFLAKFSGSEDEEVLRRIIAAGDIPLCASSVTREGLDGPISSYAPEDPCNGFFELVASGNTDNTCGNDDQCGGDLPKCRHGFCEAY